MANEGVGSVYVVKLNNERVARCAAERLITASQWFSLMPLPEDYWELSVRKENQGMVLKLIHEPPPRGGPCDL